MKDITVNNFNVGINQKQVNMNKSLRNLVIGIGAASILFSMYGVVRGGEFIDALSGIFIGVALIGTAVIQYNKRKG